MKERKLLGNIYEWNFDSGIWFSREQVVEGTVRMVNDYLCQAEPDILLGERDVVSQTRDTKVTKWVRIDV